MLLDLAIDSLLSVVGKKDQKSSVNLSERTSFRVVKTLSGLSTMCLKTKHVFLIRDPAYFTKRT